MTILGMAHMLASMMLWLPGLRSFFWGSAIFLMALSFVLWKRFGWVRGGKNLFWALTGGVISLVAFERVGTLSLSSSDLRFTNDLNAVVKIQTLHDLEKLSLGFDAIENGSEQRRMVYRYRGFAALLDDDAKAIIILFDGKGRIVKVTSTGRAS